MFTELLLCFRHWTMQQGERERESADGALGACGLAGKEVPVQGAGEGASLFSEGAAREDAW